MKHALFEIGKIPAVLYGEGSDRLFLYLYGQGGIRKKHCILLVMHVMQVIRSFPSICQSMVEEVTRRRLYHGMLNLS